MARLSRPRSTVIVAKNPDGGTQRWLPGPTIQTARTPQPKPQVIATDSGFAHQTSTPTATPVIVAQRTPRINGQCIQSYNRADGSSPATTTTVQPVVVSQRTSKRSRGMAIGSAAPAEVWMGGVFIVPALPSIPTKYMQFVDWQQPEITTTTAKPQVITRPNKLTPGKFIFRIGSPTAAPPEVGPGAPITCGRTGAFGIDRDTGTAGIVRTTAVVGILRSTKGNTGVARTTNGNSGVSRSTSGTNLITRETDTLGSTRTTTTEDPC